MPLVEINDRSSHHKLVSEFILEINLGIFVCLGHFLTFPFFAQPPILHIKMQMVVELFIVLRGQKLEIKYLSNSSSVTVFQ